MYLFFSFYGLILSKQPCKELLNLHVGCWSVKEDKTHILRSPVAIVASAFKYQEVKCIFYLLMTYHLRTRFFFPLTPQILNSDQKQCKAIWGMANFGHGTVNKRHLLGWNYSDGGSEMRMKSLMLHIWNCKTVKRWQKAIKGL